MRRASLAVISLLASCHASPAVNERAPGDRAPLSATCDQLDTFRCGLPWPSSTYTVVDKSAETGLRVSFDAAELPEMDNASFLNTADGFSRVSPLLTGFDVDIDPTTLGDLTTGSVRLLGGQPGASDFAQEIPLRMRLVAGNPGQSLLVALPRRPLLANADYVVAVMDSLHDTSGNPPVVSRAVQVALGLVKPATAGEQALASYQAPARSVFAKAGLSAVHIVRMWDFTTRSQTDPTQRMVLMRELAEQAVANGTATVSIDPVTPQSDSNIAAIVTGEINGLPLFQGTDGNLVLDSNNLPTVLGTHSAPFRVVMPNVTTSTYQVAMYGHGLGGDYMDNTFDDQIASLGLAKVASNFDGWDGAIPAVFDGFGSLLAGSAISTAGLLQSVADMDAIEHAMDGPLGTALSAPMIGGMTNPLANVRPDATNPVWVGASLGGTMGLTYAGSDPLVHFAVLNVPGAAWTQFASISVILTMVEEGFSASYGGDLDFQRVFYMSQNNWDDVDGAIWADAESKSRAYLIQESVGDPVLPNTGSEMVATCTGASMVGSAIVPIPNVPQAASVSAGNGITQYEIPDESTAQPLDIHGFAGGGTIAGEAARAQIVAFMQSVLAGSPEITLPPQCAMSGADGSCNFSGP